MRIINVEKLNMEPFSPFGFYAPLINPEAEKLGMPPIEFFRDLVQQDLGQTTRASFSVCRVERRKMLIDVTEYHNFTGEGILPLDNDILIHVGPATPSGNRAPVDKFRVFHIPQNTLVVLRPGVWHHAPFTTNDRPANVLIILPERTYANDCTVVELNKSERMRIESSR